MELVEFKHIRISVPQRLLRRCFEKKTFLSDKESRILRAKLEEFDQVHKQIEHVVSLVEVCLLKDLDKKPRD